MQNVAGAGTGERSPESLHQSNTKVRGSEPCFILCSVPENTVSQQRCFWQRLQEPRGKEWSDDGPRAPKIHSEAGKLEQSPWELMMGIVRNRVKVYANLTAYTWFRFARPLDVHTRMIVQLTSYPWPFPSPNKPAHSCGSPPNSLSIRYLSAGRL